MKLTQAEELELQALADWFLDERTAATLPKEPYTLTPGIFVVDPEKSHTVLRAACRQLAAVPGQNRRSLLWRLKTLMTFLKDRDLEMRISLGKQAGEYTPGSGR